MVLMMWLWIAMAIQFLLRCMFLCGLLASLVALREKRWNDRNSPAETILMLHSSMYSCGLDKSPFHCMALIGHNHIANEMQPFKFEWPTQTSCLSESNWKPTNHVPDVDECRHHNGGCQYKCHNTNGGYSCECPTGQQIHADGRTCLRKYTQEVLCLDCSCKITNLGY